MGWSLASPPLLDRLGVGSVCRRTSFSPIGRRHYMTARSALREMHGLVDHLYRPASPRLPAWAADHLPSQAYQDSKRDRELAEDWKTYLAWEAKNPLVIDDPAALQSRVLGSSLTQARHVDDESFPEIWYGASSYCST
ncbi:hypothetical protein V8E36_000407 [Tilletia maclaganii]